MGWEFYHTVDLAMKEEFKVMLEENEIENHVQLSLVLRWGDRNSGFSKNFSGGLEN